MKQLAERVAFAMETRRLRPVDVPRRGGPSRPTLHRILTNHDYEPDDATLNRLADALGVSRIWLKEGTGPMDSPAFLAVSTGSGKTQAMIHHLMSSTLMPTLAPGYGARVGLARREMGMSIAAASQALKIPKRRLEAFEAEDEEPGLPELMSLATGYQTGVRYLITGQSQAPLDLVREAASEIYQEPALDRGLLIRAISAALTHRPKQAPDQMATAIVTAYESAIQTGDTAHLEARVRELME